MAVQHLLPFDEAYCMDMFRRLIDVDSTTGQYARIQKLLCGILEETGVSYRLTRKGGVIAELAGKKEENALLVTAHLDDLGLMVRKINPDGTLNVCPVGGLYPFYCVTENVRIYTRGGQVYTGSVCRTPASVHVTEEELTKALPDFRTNVCVLIDEDVKNAEDVKALGIDTGDMIALEPRFVLAGGYIKSRFVDDKAAAAILLTAIKTLKESGCSLPRKTYLYFSLYEEIGHGTTWLPADVGDMLAVDIAPTGPDQTSDEHKVSIFAKDSRFPYHWEMTNELRRCAIEAGLDYVTDIFTPHYGTDCDASLLAGYDIRHAAIGPGTANSHGYERTHIKGLENTFYLLTAYMMRDGSDPQTERIRYYESLLNQAEQAQKTGIQIAKDPKLAEIIRELAAYYGSEEWKKDFAADEAGLLPPDLKRGVLSEDGIYNVLQA